MEQQGWVMQDDHKTNWGQADKSLSALAINPPVLLAPLAGITDLPFRRVVASFGAGLVVSEMVASQEIVQAKPSMRAKARAELGLGEVRTAVQLAGRDAYWLAEAARMVADNGAEIIDINMGCPAKKVVGGMSGSALMREPDLALRLIEAVIGAVDIPVTLKTRLGWDDGCLNAAYLATRAAQAGVRMVTIHGRTRCQFYKGQADWAAIGDVVRACPVPVIANGDITGCDSARRALALSGAAGVMIGRGAQGRPWLLGQVAAEIFGTPHPTVPEGADLVALVSTHYEGILSFYGRDLGVKTARKHLGWYIDAAGGTTSLRHRLLTSKDPTEVLRLLPDALTPLQNMEHAA
jgi:nifR3 family TIM-barrel protein